MPPNEPNSTDARISRALDDADAMLALLRRRAASLREIAGVTIEALRSGGKVLTCGNGGSAAEAIHLAEELLGRFHRSRRPLPAVCLCADAAALTCIANDWDFTEVFARQIEALARPGDVVIALSTSGRSRNVVRALEQARGMGVTTIGLLGAADSPAEPLCDRVLTLSGLTSARVQEAHLTTIHLLLECIDDAFAPPGETGA